jgi:hypothetical protein
MQKNILSLCEYVAIYVRHVCAHMNTHTIVETVVVEGLSLLVIAT